MINNEKNSPFNRGSEAEELSKGWPRGMGREELRKWRRQYVRHLRESGQLRDPDLSTLPVSARILGILFGIFITWFYTAQFREWFVQLPADWSRVAGYTRQTETAAWISLLVAIVGYLFYELRRRKRLLYAIVEFSAALLATTEVCLRTSEPAMLTVAIITSIYFVVRAFDNFEKGWQEMFDVMSGSNFKQSVSQVDEVPVESKQASSKNS